MKSLSLFIVIIHLISCNSSTSTPSHHQEKDTISDRVGDYQTARKLYADSSYQLALEEIMWMDSSDPSFAAGRLLLDSIDRLLDKKAQEAEIQKILDEIDDAQNEINQWSREYSAHDIPFLIQTAERFEHLSIIVRQGKSSDHKRIVTKVRSLERSLRSLQTREFPKIRKRAGKVLRDEMWEHDIDVSVRGSGYRTLRFVGGIFASNANIKEFSDIIRQNASKLRFSRLEYLWYEYDVGI